jgi:hypothetical protein
MLVLSPDKHNMQIVEYSSLKIIHTANIRVVKVAQNAWELDYKKI